MAFLLKRKFIAACGVISFILSTPAFASESVFNGVYLGAQLGFVYALFQHQSNSDLIVNTSTSSNSFLPVPTDDTASNIGPDVGLHLGYGHVFNRFYLGAEINGDLLSASVDSHSLPDSEYADLYSTSFFTGRISNTYGIDLRPGFLLTPNSMLYLKGGVQRSHVSGSATTEFAQLPDKIISALPAFIDPSNFAGPHITKLSGSSHVWGWQTGIGYEIRAGEHFSFRVEDLISGYDSARADLEVQTTPTSRILRRRGVNWEHDADMKIKPYTNVFLIGVGYYFN